MRLLIIGNSGSGKTHLAKRINKEKGFWLCLLDELCQTKIPMPIAEIYFKLDIILACEDWIIEGIYGNMIKYCIPRATHLVFLDLSPDLCEIGIKMRGPQFGEDENKLNILIKWGKLYWQREDQYSHKYHSDLYNNFVGVKWKLQSREEIENFFIKI